MSIVSQGGLWREEALRLKAQKEAEGYTVEMKSFDEGHHYSVSWHK